MAEAFASNLIIAASAGTGKTQALAKRIIQLLRMHVPPQEIVALTFSRAAAGEIFGRFVSLLAESALSSHRDAELLRQAIQTQHLSQIGTIDSFMMRIVRSFPLELGLTGQRRILESHQQDLERERISFSILRRTDPVTARVFRQAFSLAMNRSDVRSFVATYRRFIGEWHEKYLRLPDPSAWGCPETIWGETPAYVRSDVPDLAAAADRLVGLSAHADWPAFVAWVRNFRGNLSSATGLAGKILSAENLFGDGPIEITYRRSLIPFDNDASKRIREAILTVFGYVLRLKLENAAGIRSLIAEFEAEYARRVRSRGALVFGDVPRLIRQLDDEARLALEFRLDSRIRAWALDEFQDTSLDQWEALGGLVDEAKQSNGEKSVLIVGDRKQAIYGWRDGDVGILASELASGAYVTKELNRTFRSGPAVIEAVNRIFVDGRLSADYPVWQAPRHESAKPELGGFVQWVAASRLAVEAFVDPLVHALKAVDPVRRGLTTAVLVRTNAFGEYLAAELKKRGVADVVWEGDSTILDTPALVAFLDLTVLADHPGANQAYHHFRMSPLARLKYGDAVPSAAELSGELAQAFVAQGIVRVFKAWRALLPADPSAAWSPSVELRFTDLLRLADRFEREREPATRLSDFAQYVFAHSKRQVAEAGRIKVMTIHRSKGLGFDYVLLPLYEREGLPKNFTGPLVDETWILPNPTRLVAGNLPGLRRAWEKARDREEQEALCLYYVALTRARRAMTIVVSPQSAATARMSDYVRDLPETIGRNDWYEDFAFVPPVSAADDAPADGVVRRAREQVRRRLPSLGFASGQSAGELFAVSARAAARVRGTAVHAQYERVEFDEWLQRPEGFSGLWRERAFEIFDGRSWVSGRFDRVVFTGEGADRRATVYDFKTTRNTRRLPEAEFDAELRRRYASQLESYRQALSTLTGIPPDRISAALLLTESRRCVWL